MISQVTCSLGGLEIQINFCKYAIPRLEELMACFFDDENADLEQEITEPCQLTDVLIFHSLKKLQWDEIMPTVRYLSNLKCIAVKKTSFSIWSTHFISSILQESSDYFKCQEDDLKKLREDVIQMNLQFCH